MVYIEDDLVHRQTVHNSVITQTSTNFSKYNKYTSGIKQYTNLECSDECWFSDANKVF